MLDLSSSLSESLPSDSVNGPELWKRDPLLFFLEAIHSCSVVLGDGPTELMGLVLAVFAVELILLVSGAVSYILEVRPPSIVVGIDADPVL